MADIKISELEPTTDLEGLYTIGSDKNNLSKKVSLQFLKDAANYANEQGDYAKEVGDTVNGNVGVNDYPAFSASASYSAGDIVRYNGTLYQFTANHAASAWNGNDVKATSINAITSGKLTELESEIDNTIDEFKETITEQDNVIDKFKETITEQVSKYRPIEITGDVTNAADEEDITSKDGLLKFKNRSSLNGMGHVILRKNKSVAEQVTLQNTIYEIRYNFDLDGSVITMPKGCVLDFQGGKFSNGSLIGDGTTISAKEVAIFDRVNILGEWNVTDIYSTWFADIEDDNCLKNLIALSSDNCHNNMYIRQGYYQVSTPTRDERHCLELKSNTKFFLDGIIALMPNDLTSYTILRVAEKNNVTICGSGTIIGDKDTHTGTTGEWGHGIAITNGCRNVEVSGIKVKDCWGDCLAIDGNKVNENITVRDFIFDNGRRQGISVIFANGVKIINGAISNIGGTPPSAAIDVESNSDGYCYNVHIEGVKIDSKIGIITAQAVSTSTRTDIKNISIFNCEILADDYCFDFRAGYNISANGCTLTHQNNEAQYTITCQTGSQKVLFNNCVIKSQARNLFYIGCRSNDTVIKNNVIDCMRLGYCDTKPIISDNSMICAVSFLSGMCNEIVITNNSISVPELALEQNFKGAMFSGNKISCNGFFRNYIVDCNISNNSISCDTCYIGGLGVMTNNVVDCNRFEVNTDFLIVNNDIRAGYVLLKNGRLIRNSFVNSKEGEQDYFIRIQNVELEGNTIKVIRESGTKPSSYVYATSAVSICANNKFEDSEFINSIYYGSFQGSVFLNNKYNLAKSVFLPNEAHQGFLEPNVGESRPILNSYHAGFMFFDKTINKPAWWTGTKWIDATGAEVI